MDGVSLWIAEPPDRLRLWPALGIVLTSRRQDLHKLAMRALYPGTSQLYMGHGRVLYCGPIQHLETHVYGANVLHVGIYRPFRIRLADGEWRSCRCAVVPAGIRHALDMAGGVHGKLFVERNGPDATGFRKRFPYSETTVRFFEDAETIECFRWVHEEDPNRIAVEQRLDRLLNTRDQPPIELDERIRQVIERICREPDRNFSQEELAKLVDLSPSRFLHLFRQCTGLPYRRFRLWKRMVSALELLHASDTLTRAALDAGFADATHFSHSFRDTFGVNPAPVFRNIGRFEVSPEMVDKR
ncbi:AraC family transcriptional regulator [Methylocaldum sp. RMAD-M]|uniref:helix-turn-helix domain-containing protein n=1 Tax=Methylocaldum sp. RMAD-M TaxID=2806557 RepID=UPI001AE7E530|nr:AraC family transcriptional regulator [Methylocaldum sp. RMAD-M]